MSAQELNTAYVSLRYFVENYLHIKGQGGKPNWPDEDLELLDMVEIAEELGVVPFWRHRSRTGIQTIVNPKVLEEYKKRKKTESPTV